LQSSEVSSSDDYFMKEEEAETLHFLTRNVEVRPNAQPLRRCIGRIYKATFNSNTGELEIKYCEDKYFHGFDPKSFYVEGFYVTSYCLPSEYNILKEAFESEPFLMWKRNQNEN
jgi:hypothetical protein